MNVTFLGLGRMGRAMAGHVLTADHTLTVWNRTPGKAGDLPERGAKEAASVRDAVADADAVVLMLFGPEAVGAVLDDVLAAARPGTLVIDATTIGEQAARDFGQRARDTGLRYVDAPVVGTVGPAAQGTLGILVGGSEADVAAARPLLELWGDPARIRRVGEVGAGNALKTVVNLTLGVAMGGIAEALRLAHDLHLDREMVLDTLAVGPLGFSATQKREMLASGDYTPTTFSLDLMIKDLGLALDSAREDLPVTAATKAIADEAAAAGHGDDDYTAFAGYFSSEGRINSQ